MGVYKVFGNSILDQDITFAGMLDLPNVPDDDELRIQLNILTKGHLIRREGFLTHGNSKICYLQGRIEVIEKDTGSLYYILIPV